MKITDFRYFYFIGIGGIGMSALARWFRAKGFAVAGYDKTETPLTQKLSSEGISVHYQDDIRQIPTVFTDPSQTLVIYTPAVPKDHYELNFLIDNGFTVVKRAEVLGLISRDKFSIAIAGTHGKTTTSTLLAHLLKSGGKNVTAFLGGISINYNSNLIMSDSPEDECVVVEADEFDRSFLKLSPKMAVITSTDADHLDIYGNSSELLSAYGQFANLVKNRQNLVLHTHTALDKTGALTYGLENSDYKVFDIQRFEYYFRFSIETPEGKLEGLELHMPGFHNVENCTAAVAIALRLGLTEKAIRDGVSTFAGVKRRFEFVHKGSQVYVDDYAHHPSEISAFLRSLRALFPGRHLTVIFQPHLFSRTRDFMEGFAQSLALADRLLLLEIYPARELPIPGITSQVLLERIPLQDKHLVQDSDLIAFLKGLEIDILATVGAGDIDRFVPLIPKLLR